MELAIVGGGIIPGTTEDQNSYQAESGGLYSILIMIHSLEKITKKAGKLITIACNGYSALTKTLTTYKEKFSSGHRCFDLISRIIDIQDQIKTPILPVHVQGHQNDLRSDLNLLEDWNVQMDRYANQILMEAHQQNFIPPTTLPDSNIGIAKIRYQTTPITSQLDKSLQDQITYADAVQWWIQKERLTKETAAYILETGESIYDRIHSSPEKVYSKMGYKSATSWVCTSQ